MNKYSNYFKYIKCNREKFYHLVASLKQVKNEKLRLNKAQEALHFLQNNSSGIYASPFLENIFVDFAQKIPVDIDNIEYNPKSFLHVMSEAYSYGGHTRVVERWISQAANDEKHSVVLLRQKYNPDDPNDPYKIPLSLYDSLASKAGNLINLSNLTDLQERAIALRKLGMEYEYIILHIHMDDPTALVAFGTTDFKRPVIFFNHADHGFWCGVTISDMVAELNEYGQKRSFEKRGVVHSKILGIPLDNQLAPKNNSTDARRRLGLPQNQKIILTSGNERKYTSLNGNILTDCLSNILTSCPDTLCYAIGPSSDDSEWKKLARHFPDRLKIVAPLGYNEGYLDYVSASDLVVDSYPISGGTALIDASLAGKPILSLKNILGVSDYLLHSQSYCHDTEDFIKKAIKILTDADYAQNIAQNTQNVMLANHSHENWQIRKNELIASTPIIHQLYKIPKTFELPQISDEDVLIGVWHGGSNVFKSKIWKLVYRMGRSIRKRMKRISNLLKHYAK